MQIKIIVNYNNKGFKLTGKNMYIFFTNVDHILSHKEEHNIINDEVPFDLISDYIIDYPTFANVQVDDRIQMIWRHKGQLGETIIATVTTKADMAFAITFKHDNTDYHVWVTYDGYIMGNMSKWFNLIKIL